MACDLLVRAGCIQLDETHDRGRCRRLRTLPPSKYPNGPCAAVPEPRLPCEMSMQILACRDRSIVLVVFATRDFTAALRWVPVKYMHDGDEVLLCFRRLLVLRVHPPAP